MGELRVELPPDVSAEEAKLLLMVKLFETGHLSMEQAAHAAGLSLRAFMDALGRLGVPVFDYEPGELQAEADL